MSARHKGRKRALDILYAADMRNADITTVLGEEATRVSSHPEQRPAFDFAEQLVNAVTSQADHIDALITESSTAWPLERMPAVDRAILRVATGELLTMADTPTAVVVSEAASLAGEYSTEESRGFIQGILGTIAARVRPLATEG